MVFFAAAEAAVEPAALVAEEGPRILNCRILDSRSPGSHSQRIEKGRIAKGLGTRKDRCSLAVLGHRSSKPVPFVRANMLQVPR